MDYLKENDTHISAEKLEKKLSDKEVIIAKDGKICVGWLRFGYFWDFIPFMNLIAIEDKYQKKGIGSKLVQFWEEEMKKNGYDLVMTSTQADEGAQHFYRKIGYHDMGALFEINNGPVEIILSKTISNTSNGR